MPAQLPSPFNPQAQMHHFLRAMGFRYSEADRIWLPVAATRTYWTEEELARMWADAHGGLQAHELLGFRGRP